MSDQQIIRFIIDDTGSEDEFTRYGGTVEIDAEKLQQQLAVINSAMAKALEKTESPKKGMELDEITVEVGIDAEFNFAIVAKAGIKGAFTLKYKRKS